MPTRPAVPDLLARIVGVLVFLFGVFLLWKVYQEAASLFARSVPAPAPTPAPTPTPASGATPAPSAAATDAAVAIGRDLTDYVKKLLALLLMCVAGALIASMGVRAIFGPAPSREKTTP
jgi:hypothetical protein